MCFSTGCSTLVSESWVGISGFRRWRCWLLAAGCSLWLCGFAYLGIWYLHEIRVHYQHWSPTDPFV
jgi:hypothetical protein